MCYYLNGKLWYAKNCDILNKKAIELFMTLNNIEIAISETEHDYLPKLGWKEINGLLDDGVNVFLVTERRLNIGNRVFWVGDMDRWPDYLKGKEVTI